MRVTGLVSWTDGGRTREQRASTFVTETRRGLPLPRYTWGPSGTAVTVAREARVVLPGIAVNAGARDGYEVQAAVTSPARSWAWTWYRDADADGALDPAEESLVLGDTDADGIRDTGAVETDQEVRVLATALVPAAETLATAARLHHQHAAADPAGRDEHRHRCGHGHRCGRRWRRRWRRWRHDDGLLAVQQRHRRRAGVHRLPDRHDDGDHDADRDQPGDVLRRQLRQQPGRQLDKGGVTWRSSASKIAAWTYQVPAVTSLSGTATVRFWAKPKGTDATKALGFAVRLSRGSGGGTTMIGTATVAPTVWGTTGFREVVVTVPVPVTSVAKNTVVRLQVVADGSSGDDTVIAYATTAYPAQVLLPVVT